MLLIREIFAFFLFLIQQAILSGKSVANKASKVKKYHNYLQLFK